MTPAYAHLMQLHEQLLRLERDLDCIESWGRAMAAALGAGGRVLAAGNGGSAAHAQHLTAELVGRYQGERAAFSAIALHADTSTVTAIANDYGFEEVYARQVQAHGRTGDLFVALSTSGRSPNVLRAAAQARALGLTVLALTGPAPNPLASAADEVLAVPASCSATVQEVHQVVVHLLCEAFDAAVAAVEPTSAAVRVA